MLVGLEFLTQRCPLLPDGGNVSGPANGLPHLQQPTLSVFHTQICLLLKLWTVLASEVGRVKRNGRLVLRLLHVGTRRGNPFIRHVFENVLLYMP